MKPRPENPWKAWGGDRVDAYNDGWNAAVEWYGHHVPVTRDYDTQRDPETLRIEAVAYVVSCFPPDDDEAGTWDVRVESRGEGRWAVCHFRYCADADGNWDYEPSPSNREDDWKATHRFDLDTALELA